MPLLSRRMVSSSLLVLVAGVPLAACDDDAPEPEKVIATRKLTTMPEWLTVHDKIEPSIWLRSREVGHEVLSSDPEVDRLRRAMHQATIRFYEEDRMIANRTAQTGDMLGEIGQQERYVDVITGMVDVADVTVGKKLYGEMCQHYLNVRKSGKDRTAALQQLITTYKEQIPLR